MLGNSYRSDSSGPLLYVVLGAILYLVAKQSGFFTGWFGN